MYFKDPIILLESMVSRSFKQLNTPIVINLILSKLTLRVQKGEGPGFISLPHIPHVSNPRQNL